MSLSQEFSARMVPRTLLDNANEDIARLRQQLSSVLAEGCRGDADKEIRNLQTQLKTLQQQHMTAQEQLGRSMQREKDLRSQAAESSDTVRQVFQLRRENQELREALQEFRLRVERHKRVEEELERTRSELSTLQEAHSKGKVAQDQAIEAAREETATMKQAAQDARSAAERAFAVELDAARGRLQQSEEENQRLEEALQEAHRILTATDRSAREMTSELDTLRHDAGELKRQLRVERESASEGEDAAKLLREQVAALEANLVADKDAAEVLRRAVQQREEESERAAEEVARGAEALRRSEAAAAAQVGDLERQLAGRAADMRRMEEDARTLREQLREEARGAEGAARELREVLRREREQLERRTADHAAALEAAQDQRLRAEAAARRREELGQARVVSLERELETLRAESVPERRLRAAQDAHAAERQMLTEQADALREEISRLSHDAAAANKLLHERIAGAEEAQGEMAARARALERELGAREEALARETQLLRNAEEQARALRGEVIAGAGARNKTSRVAEAGLAMLDDKIRAVAEHADRAGGMLGGRDTGKSGAGATRARHAEQRAAVGIVLSSATVELVVSGSAAAACGLVAPGDTLLSVDGAEVDADSAAGALRGADEVGGVVRLALRRASTGECVRVALPRTDRQALMERQGVLAAARELRTQFARAEDGRPSSDAGPAAAALAQRTSSLALRLLELDQVEMAAQHWLAEQVAWLREGLAGVGAAARQAVSEVDVAYARVLAAQTETEQRLREQLAHRALAAGGGGEDAAGGRETVRALQEELMELEAALTAMSHELRATDLQLRAARQDTQTAQSQLEQEAARARAMAEAQRASDMAVARLRAQLDEHEALLEGLSWVVALRLDCSWDKTVRPREQRAALETALTQQVASALETAPQARSPVGAGGVHVMCWHRGSPGESVVALLRLGGGESGSGRLLGMRLVDLVLSGGLADVEAPVDGSPERARVSGAELHGPLSARTAGGLHAAALDREKDGNFREAAAAAAEAREVALRTRVAELELDLRRVVKEQLVAGEADRAREVAAARREEAALGARAAEEREAVEAALRAELAETAAAVEALREHAQGQRTGVTEREEEARRGAEALAEDVRGLAAELQRLYKAGLQVREVVEPEVRSAATTIDNIESEVGYLLAFQQRTLSLAASAGGSLDGSLAAQPAGDAAKSREAIGKDATALRDQLASLGQVVADLLAPPLAGSRRALQRASRALGAGGPGTASILSPNGAPTPDH